MEAKATSKIVDIQAELKIYSFSLIVKELSFKFLHVDMWLQIQDRNLYRYTYFCLTFKIGAQLGAAYVILFVGSSSPTLLLIYLKLLSSYGFYQPCAGENFIAWCTVSIPLSDQSTDNPYKFP